MSETTFQFLWCVRTSISVDGEIYIRGDEARIGEDGHLSIVQHAQAGLPELINMAFARGSWSSVHLMDADSDKPAAVKIWRGEV